MILQLTPPTTYDYELIDSGNGKRYERFGSYTIIRPDASCIWYPARKSWDHVDATFTTEWEVHHDAADRTKKQRDAHHKNLEWVTSLGSHGGYDLFCELALGSHKNIGLFPEMIAHWPWLEKQITSFIKKNNTPPQLLNLFGHTGITTLFMSALGATVTHVDASRPALNRATKNQDLSGLNDAPIRWILDDCIKFIERELRRGKKYDGIIMDPPAFGRDHKNRPFIFEEGIHNLLHISHQLLAADKGFFILNGYALGNSAQHLYNCTSQHIPGKAEMGELHLIDAHDRFLPCSLFVRIER